VVSTTRWDEVMTLFDVARKRQLDLKLSCRYSFRTERSTDSAASRPLHRSPIWDWVTPLSSPYRTRTG
jgi:hypothetical protein